MRKNGDLEARAGVIFTKSFSTSSASEGIAREKRA